ncbi:MAG: beta-3-deoxy-D-manno-oct-2-ulosonic acid transferase [Massilia sp.]
MYADVSPASLPPRVYAHGFSWRKRGILRRFAAPATVTFVGDEARLPDGASLLLWGSAVAPAGAGRARLVRVEDGFLRSVGLGAELAAPLSWVFDHSGIYYDATRPSDLEQMLQHAPLDADLLERAAALGRRIVAGRITKYNVGAGNWQRPAGHGQVVLVAGQVESDASLRFGAPGIASNIALLRAARKARPDAWLVYKPHPDVAAGLRAMGRDEGAAGAWCDEIVSDVAMDQMLEAVDEVHVLTSLAGFEALLRGKRVCCHGLPFYAGWGLTEDSVVSPRRTRRLTLAGLLAVALILYPRYAVGEGAAAQLSPEQALDVLLARRAASDGRLTLRRRLLRVVLGAWERRR